MWKVVGMLFLLCGTAGTLYSWIEVLRKNERSIERFLLFLQKSLYVMQTEKIKVLNYFERYIEHNRKLSMNDTTLEQVLEKIVKQLELNTFPNAQMVWENVFREEEIFQFDQEVLQIIVQAGNGFFGRSREENISFLQRSIKELEEQRVKIKEKSAQQRQVWIPVGMLSSVMLVILFL